MRLRLVSGLALANGGCSVEQIKKARPEAAYRGFGHLRN
jgi:hypothetical protein